MNINAWDDSKITELKRLHATGISFSEIGAAMGGISRNACIGKAKRLGLARRADWNDPDKPRKPRAPSRRYQRSPPPHDAMSPPRHLVDRGNNWFDLQADGPEQPRELPASAIPPQQRKTFDQLKPKHCRFIYGDPTTPDFFYCGGDKYAGAYCAYHHGITHRGIAQLTDFERERRQQFRINAHRIAMEAERMTG